MKKLNPRKAVLMVIEKKAMEAEEYDVSSEEFLSATKGVNQLAETAQKLKQIDWMEVARLGVCSGLTVLTIISSETHILDTRPVQFIKGLVMKH